jgi:AcrR family transcriptional regulator
VTGAQPGSPPGAGQERPARGTGAPGRSRRPGRPRRSGRRGGDSGTREAILAAALARFGELGYDRTTIRGIAADAGVDAALVHHFYGTKDQLFVAAMRLPLNPRDLVEAALAGDAGPAGQAGAAGQAGPAGEGRGEHIIRTVLSAWDIAEMRAAFFGLLRSATTSPQAAAMLREFATDAILGRIAEVAGRTGGGDAEYRAALVASQVLGLALTRYVLELGALSSASTDQLAAAIGPTLDRYLSGDLG